MTGAAAPPDAFHPDPQRRFALATLASFVAAIVAVVAVFVALLTKRGDNADAGAGVGHI